MGDASKVCLVIVEESETCLAVWRSHMEGIPARFIQIGRGIPPLRWLDEHGQAECVVVPALWGLDITGSRPSPDQALVLPAPPDVGTAPIRRIQWLAIPPTIFWGDTTQVMDAPAEPTVGNYTWVYRVFLTIFRAIMEFNDLHLHKIRRLGFWAKEESFLSGLPEVDASAVAAAYRECFETS